jgi:hypothetical protein
MTLPRGYTAGCVGVNSQFFVSGGMHDMTFQQGMECYDFRKGTWKLVLPAQATAPPAPTGGAFHYAGSSFPPVLVDPPGVLGVDESSIIISSSRTSRTSRAIAEGTYVHMPKSHLLRACHQMMYIL